MKVLLGEMLPIGVRELLPGHDVSTAAYATRGRSERRVVGAPRDLLRRHLDRVSPQRLNRSRHGVAFVLISRLTTTSKAQGGSR